MAHPSRAHCCGVVACQLGRATRTKRVEETRPRCQAGAFDDAEELGAKVWRVFRVAGHHAIRTLRRRLEGSEQHVAQLGEDLDVDLDDLNLVLGNFNSSVPSGTSGDVTADGFVDLADLNVVLATWGHDCSGQQIQSAVGDDEPDAFEAAFAAWLELKDFKTSDEWLAYVDTLDSRSQSTEIKLFALFIYSMMP